MTDPSAGDEVIQKAEESLKRVEEVEAKSDEAKDKLEDALGLVDEKQRRKEEKERREENEWLEGWVKEHQGEDSSILANVDAGAKDAGKTDDAKTKKEKKDKKIKDKKRDEGESTAPETSRRRRPRRTLSTKTTSPTITRTTRGRPRGLATVVGEDAEEEQRHGRGHGDYGRRRGGGIPDPSDVVARADEKVKELSEQKQEVEKKTDEVLREAAAREGIDEDEAERFGRGARGDENGRERRHGEEGNPEGCRPGCRPGCRRAVDVDARAAGDGDAEEAKGEASEDLFTGRRRLF